MMAELNSLKELLELARTATPETIGGIQKLIQPAIVELALTEVEVNQVFAALKEAAGTTLTALRGDFSTYLKANGLAAAEQDSTATQLVKLALGSGLALWHDPEGNPWATLRVNGHAEHHPLKTKAVRRFLAQLFYTEHESAPHAQGLQDALMTLEAKAVFEGPEHPTFVRLAEVDGIIYLDLANERWQVVRVSPQGWEVVEADNVPVRFRRPRGMSPLPTPQTGGTLTELAGLLNVSVDLRDWKLIVGWLLQALRGTGPYPVLVLTGGQGSGKSTAARMLRALLDPNVSPLRSLSRGELDLFIAATNGWALVFDNVSGLSQWISDSLCKLATGGGLSVRELFSDADETLLNAMRPVLLNGITDFIDRQDLVDRALQVHLPSIPKTDRRPEKELWAKFDAAQPRILGALLDVVANGLQRLPNTTLDTLPRLADFALWATACEAPLGWQSGAFIAAYQDAQSDLIKDALEAEPVAVHLLTFLKPGEEWTGTASELLSDLSARAGYADKRPPKGWPGAPHVLAGALKRIAPALLEQGLEVTQLSRDPKGRTKQWQVRTIGENKDSERSERSEAEQGGDSDASASGDANARSVQEDGEAFADKPREGQHPNAANAASAPNTTSSNDAGTDTPNWDGLDLDDLRRRLDSGEFAGTPGTFGGVHIGNLEPTLERALKSAEMGNLESTAKLQAFMAAQT